MYSLRRSFFHRFLQAKHRLTVAKSCFLRRKKTDRLAAKWRCYLELLGYRLNMVVFSLLAFLMAIPLFLLPKHRAFPRYTQTDEEGVSLDSYVIFCRQRDISLVSLAAVLIFISVQILVSTPISLSQPRLAHVVLVCPESCEYQTIQAAIKQAEEGDVIRVGDGTYREDINFLGKSLRLESEHGPEKTIVEGTGTSSVVTVNKEEPEGATLKGFTIRGGVGTTITSGQRVGGGVFISGAKVNLVLTDNIFEDNQADFGGAIYSNQARIILEKNTVAHNTARNSTPGSGYGGGLYVEGGHVRMSETQWTQNQAVLFGGAVALYHTEADISGNTFLQNQTTDDQALASGGGAVSLINSQAAIMGNTFTENTSATSGGALLVTGEKSVVTLGGTSQPDGNIFTDNRAEQYGGQAAFDQVPEAQIIGNTFSSTKRQVLAARGGGTSVLNAGNITIRNNVFKMLRAEQVGALMLSAKQSDVVNNLFKMNEAKSGSAAVLIKDTPEQSELLFRHNVLTENSIKGVSGAALEIEDAPSRTLVVNNVIEKSGGAYSFLSTAELPKDGFIFAANNLWKNALGPSSEELMAVFGETNFSINSLFVDSDKDDYHLQEGSLLINRGFDHDPLLPDIDEQSRPFSDTLPDVGLDEMHRPVQPRHLYVHATEGNDEEGLASRESPLASLAQALTLMVGSAGAEISVAGKVSGGVVVTPLHSGRPNQPLHIQQWAEEESAVIDASGYDYGLLMQKADDVWIDGLAVTGARQAGLKWQESDYGRITNSVIYDQAETGILVDSSNELKIVNNTLVNNKVAIRFQNSAIAGTVRNNVIQINDQQKGVDLASDSVNLFHSDFNNWFRAADRARVGQWTRAEQTSLSEWQEVSKQDAHSISLDPLFAEASTANFQLKEGSPSLDAGDPDGFTPAADRLGQPRPYQAVPNFIGRVDQGAYETELPRLPIIESVHGRTTDNNQQLVDIELTTNNPAGTQYAVAIDDGQKWIQLDGRVSTEVFWSEQLVWSHAGTDASTTYQYQAKARNGAGTTYTGWSQAASFTTPLNPPTNLRTTGVTDHGATFAWQSVPGTAVTYQVSYGTDPDASNVAQVKDLENADHSVSKLEAGTTYYWKVKVINENGESVWGNTAVFTTGGQKETAPPPAEDEPASEPKETPVEDQEQTTTPEEKDSEETPADVLTLSDIRALADATKARITWQSNKPASSKVEYGSDTKYGGWIEQTELTTTHSVELTDLNSDTLYHFKVTGVTENGEKYVSGDLTFTTSEVSKTPIIVSPESFSSTTQLKPLITGLAESGVTVEIYLDGLYDGDTATLTTNTGTGSFAYTPKNDLVPGEHVVEVLAENLSGTQSFISSPRTFYVFSERVSTVMKLIHDEYVKEPINSTAEKRPNLVGLAPAGSTVKIYLDKAQVATFVAPGETGSVIDFVYRPEFDLTDKHQAYYETWNSESALTSRSFELTFRIVPELPAPTILTPRAGEEVDDQPVIAGVASDHDQVKVFIDNVLYGEITAQTQTDDQPTGYFEYHVPLRLSEGKHELRVQAEDQNGKKSKMSEPMEMIVKKGE